MPGFAEQLKLNVGRAADVTHQSVTESAADSAHILYQKASTKSEAPVCRLEILYIDPEDIDSQP